MYLRDFLKLELVERITVYKFQELCICKTSISNKEKLK